MTANCKRCGESCPLVYCSTCDQIIAQNENGFHAWWHKTSPYSASRLRRAYYDVAKSTWMAKAELDREELERAKNALAVIAFALYDDKGNYWAARDFLEKNGKYADNLEGNAVLIEVADVALRPDTVKSTVARLEAENAAMRKELGR